MNCEFCRKQEKNSSGDVIWPMDKIATDEGGEIRCCNDQKCIDKIPARKAEMDTLISGWKQKQTAQLQEKYSGLKTELAKPDYSSLENPAILARMNNKNFGVTEDLPVISNDDIKKCFDKDELKSLSPEKSAMLAVMVAGGSLDLEDQSTKDIIEDIFPGNTKTRVNITKKRVKKKSISENLGYIKLKPEDIERARLI